MTMAAVLKVRSSQGEYEVVNLQLKVSVNTDAMCSAPVYPQRPTDTD